MSNRHHDRYEGAPEKYLVADMQGSELDTDAINCALLRAQALIALLHTQFSSGNDIEKVTDRIVVGALWGVSGYLDQIKILTKI